MRLVGAGMVTTEGDGATLALAGAVLGDALGDGLAPVHAANSAAAIATARNGVLPTFTVCLLKHRVVETRSGAYTTLGVSRQEIRLPA
jgi:hypothetical protein